MPKTFSKKIEYRFLDFFGNLLLASCVQTLRPVPPKLFTSVARVSGTFSFYLAIEDSIRQYPEWWPWLNRRWKKAYQEPEPAHPPLSPLGRGIG